MKSAFLLAPLAFASNNIHRAPNKTTNTKPKTRGTNQPINQSIYQSSQSPFGNRFTKPNNTTTTNCHRPDRPTEKSLQQQKISNGFRFRRNAYGTKGQSSAKDDLPASKKKKATKTKPHTKKKNPHLFFTAVKTLLLRPMY